jgi:tetratricopeptide (TPR) repeat protein
MPVSLQHTSKLFSNRSAAFLKIGSNQSAKLDAEQALQFAPNDKKAQFRLASALFHLGSYRNALNVLRPMQSTDNGEIQTLLRHVIVCEEENRTGVYDIPKIEAEARQNSRLFHANYCSSAIELRASRIGGLGGRGIFAKAVIPQGTLLVASN